MLSCVLVGLSMTIIYVTVTMFYKMVAYEGEI